MPGAESNMYVMMDGREALVIDPSVQAEAEALLKEAGTERCTVLLTHEHFDHISGVNRLRELFPCQVICTEGCARMLGDPRKNLAAFFAALFFNNEPQRRQEAEKVMDFGYACQADEVYQEEKTLAWQGLPVLLKALPGHSKGSQIIRVADRYVFSGDYLIPGEEVITRLPGGSRIEYEQITLPYLKNLPQNCVVFPGHGDDYTISRNLMEERHDAVTEQAF